MLEPVDPEVYEPTDPISSIQEEQKTLAEQEGGVISLLERTFPNVEIEPQIRDIYNIIWEQNPYSLFPKYRREDKVPKGDFGEGHQRINTAIIQEVLPQMLKGDISACVLAGPMHSGKTNLMKEFLGILEGLGYSSEFYVINTIGDTFVVADGEKPKKIDAIRFGGEFQNLPQNPLHELKICALDEYTFGDVEDVKDFAQNNYFKNIPTLFSGLKTTSLGAETEPYVKLDYIFHGIPYKLVHCQSYIHRIDNMSGRGLHNLTEPSGDRTVRFVRTINPSIDLLDAGLFDTIVSKEQMTLGKETLKPRKVVQYTPNRLKDTVCYHLENYPKLWEYVSTPEDPVRDSLRHERTQSYINNY